MTDIDQDTAVVIGAGTMGLGITQNLLQVGATVCVTDAFAATAENGRGRIADGLRRTYKADVNPAARAEADLARLHVTIGPIPSARPALVIEAVPEIPSLKATVLAEAEAEAAYPDAAVLGSNTSSLSINGLAGGLARPERFIGMHFFNPVPLSVLVELVLGDATSPASARKHRGA